MDIFREIEPLRAFLKEKRASLKSIGLVPTMGALHMGHLSLIRASRGENDVTVASIYVNPTQFNNSEDLDKYPRSEDEDIQLLKKEGCDILFIPSNNEMYSGAQQLRFDFGQLDKLMEGKFRPGHFSGVALVVSKLFNIVHPDRAYFGQKDYQQFQIINRLKEELKFSIDLRSVPIVREDSGLAMSSRNQRLNSNEREQALMLYESLLYAKQQIKKGVEFGIVKEEVEARFTKNRNLKLEYFTLANRKTLQPLDKVQNLDEAIILIAAFVNEVRLIDNILLDSD